VAAKKTLAKGRKGEAGRASDALESGEMTPPPQNSPVEGRNIRRSRKRASDGNQIPPFPSLKATKEGEK